jgi:hypothetical protein
MSVEMRFLRRFATCRFLKENSKNAAKTGKTNAQDRLSNAGIRQPVSSHATCNAAN